MREMNSTSAENVGNRIPKGGFVMKRRLVGALLLVLALLACNGKSPTEPVTNDVSKSPTPDPTETPTHGCSGGQCNP
jgi:hypothetical protein